jgi:16S rRNA (cytidine1402-2'-O)-methyltransferase
MLDKISALFDMPDSKDFLVKKSLYIVATPIGNRLDITIRAIQTLRHADIVIGEERPTTEKLLKSIGIYDKEIWLLNEHNEHSDAPDIVRQIIQGNLATALISEAGTPCIADPGATLVNLCYQNNISVIAVPGVCSIMTALMVSGLVKPPFKYIGFLSANTQTRQAQMKQLAREHIPAVLLETPYRLKATLSLIQDTCGSEKMILFAYKLTTPDELVIKSTIKDIANKTSDIKKGEFVIVLL